MARSCSGCRCSRSRPPSRPSRSRCSSCTRCSARSSSSSSQTTNRLRPSSLARYSARSASRSRSIRVGDCSCTAATPTLALVTTRCPLDSSYGRPSTRTTSAATSSKPTACSPCTSSTNSSPPSRPTSAPSGACVRSRSATATSSRSPTWCPRLSLTILNRSRSSIISTIGRSSDASAWSTRTVTMLRLASPVTASVRAIRSSVRCWLLWLVTSRTCTTRNGSDTLEPCTGMTVTHTCRTTPSDRTTRRTSRWPSRPAAASRPWSSGTASSSAGATSRSSTLPPTSSSGRSTSVASARFARSTRPSEDGDDDTTSIP